MKTIAVVVGTRPECIKLAPVYFALKSSTELQPILVATGQHRQMLDQALRVFDLKPDVDLDIMQIGQSLESLTGRIISAFSKWLDDSKPDAIIVQGDTTTVLASSLAAYYKNTPIGHVEAGLRTGDIRSPFPEEMNRRLTAPLARWNFCPTPQSRDNLLREGIEPDTVHVTGNTVIDALVWVRQHFSRLGITYSTVAEKSRIPDWFVSCYLEKRESQWVLITAHRRESFGEGFSNICSAILQLAEKYPSLGFIFPVHMNPHVRSIVYEKLGNNPRIALIEPADYPQFVWLMSNSHFIISDSGGVQEEAPSLGKPVLVTREATERPEGINAGTCRLVGTDPEAIIREASLLMDSQYHYQSRTIIANPYGDGNSAARIVNIMKNSI
jgi:UDP-N-acetylglucosamine 2-epimerase